MDFFFQHLLPFPYMATVFPMCLLMHLFAHVCLCMKARSYLDSILRNHPLWFWVLFLILFMCEFIHASRVFYSAPIVCLPLFPEPLLLLPTSCLLFFLKLPTKHGSLPETTALKRSALPSSHHQSGMRSREPLLDLC